MRFPRTFSLYLSREILLFGGLSFLGVTSVLVSQQLLELLGRLATIDTSGLDYLRLLSFVVSALAAYSAPISFSLGVTLAVGRLAADLEVLAARSCGIGLGTLLLPTCVIALGITALSAWLVMEAEPRSRLDLRQLVSDVARKGSALKPGFFRVLGDRTIFVEDRDLDGQLRGVMVYDNTNANRPYVAFAERGGMDFEDATGDLTLKLESGEILFDPDAKDPDTVQVVYFDSFTYMLDVQSLKRFRYAYRSPDELSFAEILDTLDRIDAGTPLERVRKHDRRDYERELHRRLALPLAPMLFGLIAVPFGLISEGRGRSIGLLGCTAVVFGYYALMTLGRVLIREEWVGPAVGYWSPNAALALIAFLMLRRASRAMRE